MPKISFKQATSRYELCPHNGLHGTHTTKDGRLIGICMMGDGHLLALERYLRNLIDAMFQDISNDVFAWVERTHAKFYDPEIADAEHKLDLVHAEQRRRKLNRSLKHE